MEIVINSNTIEVDGLSYKKGSIRPVQVGDLVSLMFPYWNNQSIGSDSWENITVNGTPVTSAANFKAIAEANFYTNTSAKKMYKYSADALDGTLTKMFSTVIGMGHFVVTNVYAVIVRATTNGDPITAPKVDMGVAPGYNSTVKAYSMLYNTAGVHENLTLQAQAPYTPENTDFFLRIVPAVGYSTFLVDFYIEGFYENAVG